MYVTSDVKGKYFANLRVIKNCLRDADCDTHFVDEKGVPTKFFVI